MEQQQQCCCICEYKHWCCHCSNSRNNRYYLYTEQWLWLTGIYFTKFAGEQLQPG